MARVRQIVLVVLTVVWACYIWHFSFSDASASSETSGQVMETCNEVLETVGVPIRFTQHSIRKTAHFTEFFLLGVLAFGAVRSFRARFAMVFAAPIPVSVAAVDECIQFFSAGRGPAVTDVLLDSCGGFCGIAVAFGVTALYFFIIKRKNRKKNRKTS